MISRTRFTLSAVLICLLIFSACAWAHPSPSSVAETPKELTALARSPEWIKLLHYEKTRDGYRSRITDPSFFVSQVGRTSPESEIIDTWLRFSRRQTSDSDLSDSGIECRFPARFLFFKTQVISSAQWKMPACPGYEHFYRGIGARSATLVFSSYYLNNPSSAFGHTFLRLNKNQAGEPHHPLLDYGIGFAATVGDTDPFRYVIGGLMGWFDGTFTSVPYYLKVQEYNDFESRDLWEYDLNLTQNEVDLLVAHFWELAQTRIGYRYLTDNCSSLLIDSLEAAAPRLAIKNKMRTWVVPADSVRALYSVSGLVERYRFRPSKRAQFLTRLKQLTADQKIKVARSLEATTANHHVPGWTEENDSEVLDTLIDYYDFRYFKELLREDPVKASLKHSLLMRRSQLPMASEPFHAQEPQGEAPQAGHGSTRASLGAFGDSAGALGLWIGYRFSLHDHLDPQSGYPVDSEIGFFDFEARFGSRSPKTSAPELQLEKAAIIDVKSFAPYQSLVPNLSWKLRFGAERNWDASCDHCAAAVLGGGLGLTYDLTGSHHWLVTLLATGETAFSHEFSGSPFRLRLGPEINFRWLISDAWITQINAQDLWVTSLNRWTLRTSQQLRFHAERNKWSIGLSFTQIDATRSESRLISYFYF